MSHPKTISILSLRLNLKAVLLSHSCSSVEWYRSVSLLILCIPVSGVIDFIISLLFYCDKLPDLPVTPTVKLPIFEGVLISPKKLHYIWFANLPITELFFTLNSQNSWKLYSFLLAFTFLVMFQWFEYHVRVQIFRVNAITVSSAIAVLEHQFCDFSYFCMLMKTLCIEFNSLT